MLDIKTWAQLAGRVLLAAILLYAGFRKIGTIDMVAARIASKSLPYPLVLAYCAMMLELVGGLMLMMGLWARWLALVFFGYVLVLAVLYHGYWAMEASEQRAQATLFFFHLGLAGGMLYLWAAGPGRLTFRRS